MYHGRDNHVNHQSGIQHLLYSVWSFYLTYKSHTFTIAHLPGKKAYK